ncbi:MAG: hypothetical protein LBN30_10935 [Oscillospiraceae bacterium]|jgi:hypothetical protein|nr:hypothetical protein [Oscillospiraceae bacterium]
MELINPFELINRNNSVLPNYDLSGREFSFDIYLCHTQEICIIGRLDNNYICGLSFSGISNIRRTQTIIDSMAVGSHVIVSTEYKVLGSKYDEIRNEWYRLKLSKVMMNEEVRYYCAGVDYQFPQSGIADNIKNAFDNLLKTCDARMAESAYLNVLQSYCGLLSKYKRGEPEAASYYVRMKPLIAIMETENYLRLSSDSDIRDLFVSIVKSSKDLYNAYMDEAR